MVASTSFASGLSGGWAEAGRTIGKHLVGLLLGGMLLTAGALAPLRALRNLAPLFLAVCLVALAVVFVPGVGHSVGYHSRWVSLGGWQCQPSEFAKVGLVLYLATVLSNRLRAKERGRPTQLWGPLGVSFLMIIMVAAEPNFATAAVMFVGLLAMLYVGGERKLLVLGLALAAASLLYVGLQLDPGNKFDRMRAFLAPGGLQADPQGIGYQTIQSVNALGAGGLVGWGLGASSAKFGALPYSHTDFVFAVLGQEMGLVGCLLVLVCYVALALNGLAIAQRQQASFPALLAAGLALMLTLQALVNIAIAVAWCVPMGVPLPFVSYGGSSLAASLGAVGLLINCARQAPGCARRR